MKNACFIYNPSAGREKIKRHLPLIIDRLQRLGYQVSVQATGGAGDAAKLSRAAARGGCDLVVAAGGDGTVSEVVGGLAEEEHRPVLGLIPAGTTNDFARALGIPRQIEWACDLIIEESPRPVDIGRVNGRYFINIAAGGRLTELTYAVPSEMKTRLGQLAYYLKGAEMLPSLKPVPVSLEYEGGRFAGEIMLFLVTNTNSVGGFEKLAPPARLDDGRFDLLIVKKTGLAEFIGLLGKVLLGEHLKDERVIYTQTSWVKVTNAEKMQLNLDGEYGGLLPGDFVNLPRHIQVLAPPAR